VDRGDRRLFARRPAEALVAGVLQRQELLVHPDLPAILARGVLAFPQVKRPVAAAAQSGISVSQRLSADVTHPPTT
jgi:hypothetical protein